VNRVWMMLLLAVSTPCLAQSLDGKPFIAAQGQAKKEVVPDRFPLVVTLSDVGMDAAKTRAKIEGLAEVVVASAVQQGIPDKDVEVRNLSIEPMEEWNDKTEQDVFEGNKYERVIKVTFRSLGELKTFFDALPKGKEVSVETGTFIYSEERAATKKLLQDAMADARATADSVAANLGKRIIGVHNVSDTPQGREYFRGGYSTDLESVNVTGNGVAAAAAGRPAKLVLKEGQVTLTRTVYVIYLLEP
jgi:uncharacterized protein